MYYVGSEANFKKLQEALKKIYENEKENTPTIELIDITNKSTWGELKDTTVESIADKLKGENNFVLFGTEASNLLDEINSDDNRKLCDKLIKAFENEKKNKLNNESVANDGNDDKEDLESSFLSQSKISIAPEEEEEEEDFLHFNSSQSNEVKKQREKDIEADKIDEVFGPMVEASLHSQPVVSPTPKTPDEDKMSEGKVVEKQTTIGWVFSPFVSVCNRFSTWWNGTSNQPVDNDDDISCT